MSTNAKAWRCVVCGYIHHGDAPPEICPVCGAPASDFEAHIETPPPPQAPAGRWRCVVCGYIHEGPTPPDECPLCGAGPESFEADSGEPRTPSAPGRPARVAVIGGGIAAVSAVEAIRQASPDSSIAMISGEAELPYYRLNLTRLLAGEIAESALTIHSEDWYIQNRIALRLGMEIRTLSATDKKLTAGSGETIEYDKLILCTGAHPFMPPIEGIDLPGVFALRTTRDAQAILEKTRPGRRCVCVGGGILGLETAGALVRRGMNVTLLESHGYLMPRQLNAAAGEIMRQFIMDLGIDLMTRVQSKAFLGSTSVEAVQLTDGRKLPADLVLVTTGVRSNTWLARQAGLDVHHGITVGNRLQTSHPDIYAAGDCAEHAGILYGSWQAAQYQGRIAGMNAAGQATEFGGLPRSHTLKVLGLDMLSVGCFEPPDGSYLTLDDESLGHYMRFVFHDGCLVGALLLGNTALSARITRAVDNRENFHAFLNKSPTARDIASRLGEN